jgi:hypothetical protein
MNIYPAPGSYGGVYAGQQESRPAWPTVVGIISLCVAGIFGLMTIGSMIYNASGLGTAQQREMMENMPDWFHPCQWLVGLFTMATYVVLAIGGVMLLKRRRAGRTLHFAYAHRRPGSDDHDDEPHDAASQRPATGPGHGQANDGLQRDLRHGVRPGLPDVRADLVYPAKGRPAHPNLDQVANHTQTHGTARCRRDMASRSRMKPRQWWAHMECGG